MNGLLTDVEHLIDHAEWMNVEGQPIEAITVLGEVLDQLSHEPASALQSRALRGVGLAFRTLGDIAESGLAYQEALDVARSCGNQTEQAEALNGLAIATQLQGDLDHAEDQYAAAGKIATQEGLFQLTGIIEQNRGVVASDRGDFDGAREHYDAALRAFQTAGDITGACWTLNNLGLLSSDLDRPPEALEFFDRARRAAADAGDPTLGVRIEINRADTLMRTGEWEAAQRTLETAISVARTTSRPLLVAEGLRYLAKAERQAGRPWNALRRIRQAIETATAVPDLLLLGEAHREAGACWLALGDRERAREAWQESAARFEEVGARQDHDHVTELLTELV